MKTQSIVVPILLLTVVPCIGMAETPRGQLASEAVDPPTLQHIVATAATQPRGAIAELLAVEPQIPLGPLDVLRQYE